MIIRLDEARIKALLSWYRQAGATKLFTVASVMLGIPEIKSLVDVVWKEGADGRQP